MKFGGDEVISTVRKNTTHPDYLERITLQITTPTIADKIRIQLRDSDFGTKDDIIATTWLSFSEISSHGLVDWSKPRWINLYGSPTKIEGGISKTGQLADKMNLGFIEGNDYRGRILISTAVQLDANPKVSSFFLLGVSDLD